MNLETIKELRGQIDSIDDQIIELVIKRIHLSNTLIRMKAPGQIVDSHREQEIYSRYGERLGGVSTERKVKQFVKALLGASNLYPEP